MSKDDIILSSKASITARKLVNIICGNLSSSNLSFVLTARAQKVAKNSKSNQVATEMSK